MSICSRISATRIAFTFVAGVPSEKLKVPGFYVDSDDMKCLVFDIIHECLCELEMWASTIEPIRFTMSQNDDNAFNKATNLGL